MDRETPVTNRDSLDDGRDRQKSLVADYYESLDTHTYDQLETLLHPEFVHERPDMTLSGRDEFIRFMRDDRPNTDTSHPIDTLYPADNSSEIAVRGRLLSADEALITEFVDIFSFGGEQIERIRTFTP